MIPEAQLEQTAEGLVAKTDGWFVLNARESRWYHVEGRSAFCDFEGELDFTQLGMNIGVLGPGEAMAMYHWEADQEDFLVVAGECLLVIEGEERRLEQWDFVHCPPWTEHVFVGAGSGPCAILAFGGRTNEGLVYPRSELALRHGAGVEQRTTEPDEAYEKYAKDEPTAYRDGWLPG